MNKYLIVVDMQNDFVTGALRNEEAIKIVPNVISRIKQAYKNHEKVIFTKDFHRENYLSTEEGKNLPVEHCIENTEGADFIPEIRELFSSPENDYLYTTYYYKSTFGSVPLGRSLEYLEETAETIDEVELIGVCTDICVISNALLIKAFLPNAHIVVDASCCAGVTPESHKNALNAMKACHIEIINEE